MKAVAAALLLALSATPAMAAALVLGAKEQQDAVRVGERSVTNDAFDAEWRVTNERGEWVSVLTPFHRLVIAGRHAAFNGRPLKPGEPEKLLNENRDRLIVLAELHGTREDFARLYTPRLVMGDREIKAAFVQNERTANRLQDGRYVARCMYGFPTRDIDGRARVLLVIADGNGRDVGSFAIELGKMR